MAWKNTLSTTKEENIMSNKVYDALKWIVMIVLPALAILYGKIAGIWGLPFAEQIPDTITAIELFLGAALMISSAQYNKKKAE